MFTVLSLLSEILFVIIILNIDLWEHQLTGDWLSKLMGVNLLKVWRIRKINGKVSKWSVIKAKNLWIVRVNHGLFHNPTNLLTLLLHAKVSFSRI
jgi:hypothetical protein